MRWIRKILGIDAIIQVLSIINDNLSRIDHNIAVTRADMAALRAEIMGMFKSEFDPIRKAASDALADATITRLVAEGKARKHTIGEL